MLNQKGLPTQPHPIVKAFSNALQNDLILNKNTHGKNSNTETPTNSNDKENGGGDNSPSSSTKTKNKQSSVVKKVSQTLGWRNRYSQSTYYPIEIEYKCNSSHSSSNSNTEGQQSTETTVNGINAATTKTTVLEMKQVQRGEIENTFGTGATVWPASLVLVKYLEHCILTKQHDDNGCSIGEGERAGGGIFNCFSSNNRNISIADLGSGTGVTSIAIAFFLGLYGNSDEIEEPLGQEKGQEYGHPRDGPFIVCTDGCDSVVGLARENIENTVRNITTTSCDRKTEEETNGAEKTINDNLYQIGRSRIKVRKYLWGDGTLLKELELFNRSAATGNRELSEKGHASYDIIVVSDCVLPKLYPIEPLVDAIDELSGPQTIAYISYEYRYYPEYDPKEFFISLAEDRGLEVKTIAMQEQHPIYSVDDIEIWEVRRKNTEKV